MEVLLLMRLPTNMLIIVYIFFFQRRTVCLHKRASILSWCVPNMVLIHGRLVVCAPVNLSAPKLWPPGFPRSLPAQSASAGLEWGVGGRRQQTAGGYRDGRRQQGDRRQHEDNPVITCTAGHGGEQHARGQTVPQSGGTQKQLRRN